jgi:hypothetical protein
VDINNAGMIVGSGSYDPDGPFGGAQPLPRSFLLVPVPEPGPAAVLLAAGGLALLSGRGRGRIRSCAASG